MSEQVIIVTGGDYDSEFATKLHNLLPEHDVESVVWTEKQFDSNKPTLSNRQRVIFFGRKDEAKKQAKTVTKWGFDMYGCKIGIVNNVCVITAKDSDLPFKHQQEFAFYCEQRAKDHPDIIVPTVVTNPAGIGKLIKGIVEKDDKTIRRAQYSILVYEFIDKWLDAYISDKPQDEA